MVLALHDVSGRRVAVLQDAVLEAGSHRVTAELTGAGGSPLGPGLYWARLETPWGVRLARIAVLK